MQIHQLQSRNKEVSRRKGRGGKRGTYSGRGVKGQKSRSGGNVDPLFEGGRSSLIDRLKKSKGFKSAKVQKTSVSIEKLDRYYEDGDVVSPKTLVRKGLVDKVRVKHGVKLIGGGELTKKLTIKSNVHLTQSVESMIKKLGGTIEHTTKEK